METFRFDLGEKSLLSSGIFYIGDPLWPFDVPNAQDGR